MSEDLVLHLSDLACLQVELDSLPAKYDDDEAKCDWELQACDKDGQAASGQLTIQPRLPLLISQIYDLGHKLASACPAPGYEHNPPPFLHLPSMFKHTPSCMLCLLSQQHHP